MPPLLVGLLLAALLLGGVASAPWQRFVGAPSSPAGDHLWGLSVTAQGLWTQGPLIRDADDIGFPDGFRALQYEAANLLLFLPGYWLGGGGVAGRALGWNGLHAGVVVLGALGAALLGRRSIGPRPALLVMAAAFAGSPWLLAHPTMGHSEYLAVWMLPWALWAGGRFLAGEGLRWAVLAAACLATMAATASYLPVFLALVVTPWLGAEAWARRRPGRLLLMAALAVPPVLGFAWLMTLPWPQGHAALAGQFEAAQRPGLVLGPQLSGMLRLWPGPPEADNNEQAAYLGLAALALGAIGAAVDRRARAALALALGLGILTLGTVVQVGGQRWLLPAGWLEALVPPLAMVHFWQRLAPVLALPLALAAAIGADWLGRRAGRPLPVAIACGALLLVDQATWPRGLVLPAATTELAAPAALLRLVASAPPGALVPLPFALPNLAGPQVSTGPMLLWQLEHGRPISTRQALLSDGLLRTSWLLRTVGNSQADRPGRGEPGPVDQLSAPERACARADVAALRSQGFAALLLSLEAGEGDRLRPLLDPLFVERTDGAFVLYPLDVWEGGEEEGTPCALPAAARKLASVLRL